LRRRRRFLSGGQITGWAATPTTSRTAVKTSRASSARRACRRLERIAPDGRCPSHRSFGAFARGGIADARSIAAIGAAEADCPERRPAEQSELPFWPAAMAVRRRGCPAL